MSTPPGTFYLFLQGKEEGKGAGKKGREMKGRRRDATTPNKKAGYGPVYAHILKNIQDLTS